MWGSDKTQVLVLTLPSKYRAVEKHMAVLEFSVLGKLNAAEDKTACTGSLLLKEPRRPGCPAKKGGHPALHS